MRILRYIYISIFYYVGFERNGGKIKVDRERIILLIWLMLGIWFGCLIVGLGYYILELDRFIILVSGCFGF